MEYTAKQIANAKQAYYSFLQERTVESYEPEYIGWNTAEQRCEFHNNIVRAIVAGNKELESKWKLFFLTEEVKKDSKKAAAKSKLAANKAASSDVLASIKQAGKLLGDYYKWLNTSGNQFRKEFFSKKYSSESVNTFLSL